MNHTFSPTNRILEKTATFCFFFFIIPSLAILIRGYHFPSGNHGQEVPPILALIDGELFTRDFAVQSFLNFGPRWYYQQIIYFFNQLGLPIETVYFFLYWIALASFGLGAFLIGKIIANRRLSRDGAIAVGAIFAIYAFLPVKGWSEDIIRPISIPSMFAMGIVVWGIYAAVRLNVIFAYTMFGIASLLQFLVGLYPGLLFLPIAISQTLKDKKYLRLFLAVVLFGTGLAMVYIPMTFFVDHGKIPDKSDIMWVFGFVRVPHHWLPSTGNILFWLNDYAYYVSAILLAYKLRSELAANFSKAIITIITLGALGPIINFIFVELVFIDLIGSLQLQRIMPFTKMAVLFMLAFTAVHFWLKNDYVSAIVFGLAPLIWIGGFISLVATIVLTIPFKLFRWIHYSQSAKNLFLVILLIIGIQSTISFSIELFLLGITAFALYIYYGSIKNLSSRIIPHATIIVAIISLSIVLLAFSNVIEKIPDKKFSKFIASRYLYNKEARNEIEILALQFSAISNKEDLIIIPPLWEFEMFQYYSKRSVFFSWKNVPYDAQSIKEWAYRLELLIGKKPEKRLSQDNINKLFFSLDENQIIQIAHQHHANYFLTDIEHHTRLPWTVMLRSENWVIYKITDTKGSFQAPDFYTLRGTTFDYSTDR